MPSLTPFTFECGLCFETVTEEMTDAVHMFCCEEHRRFICTPCFEEVHPNGIAPCVIDWDNIWPPVDLDKLHEICEETSVDD